MPTITPEMMKLMQVTAPKSSEVKGKTTKGFSSAEVGIADTSSYINESVNDSLGDYGMPDTTQYLNEAQVAAMQASRTAPSSKQPMQYRDNPNSKLPAAIKNVLAKNAGVTAEMAQPAMKMSDEARLIMEKTQRVATPVQQATPAPTAGFDYSLLRAIVKECIDEKFKELDSKVLTEGSLKTISLKEGNIRLIDNSGNVYKAKLEMAGNINDKKK